MLPRINDPAPRGGVLIDKECFAVTPQAAGYKSQGFAINKLLLLISCILLCSCGKEKDIPVNQEYGKNENITIMKFHADWCGPCQAMKPEYEKVKKLYPYIQFAEIDFDREKGKVIFYNVNSIPLTIKKKEGKELKRHTGYMNRNDLVRFIEN
jgi:thiol-disulfide isomerase/thioredoxin